jgi:hypothetical protein
MQTNCFNFLLVSLWQTQIERFSLESKTCNGSCSHFEQMISWNTDRFGCGFTKGCDKIKGQVDLSNVLVCRYSSSSRQSVSLFESGEKCSKCPEEMPHCNNGLCSKTLSMKALQSCNDGASEHQGCPGDGLRYDNACCPDYCGSCGGRYCGSRPGGYLNCCRNWIMRLAPSCSTGQLPCQL